MQNTDMREKKLITRKELVGNVLDEYEKLPAFMDGIEALKMFKNIFDRMEEDRRKNNEDLKDPDGEKAQMAMHPGATDSNIWHTVTAKHVLIFSIAGAFALYREDKPFDQGTEAKDINPYDYKNQEKKLQYKKLDASGKNVWGE